MTPEEHATIGRLRDRGYAICIFSPEELRGADPVNVEGDMCTRGWDVIEVLAAEAFEEFVEGEQE